MSQSARIIAFAAIAAMFGGCAVDSGVDDRMRLAHMLEEYEAQLDSEAEVETGQVELLAADALGRRLERSRRLRE